MKEYPKKMELDRELFTVKRNGKAETVCFSDLSRGEQRCIVQGKSGDYCRELCIQLAARMREIGEMQGNQPEPDYKNITGAFVIQKSYDNEWFFGNFATVQSAIGAVMLAADREEKRICKNLKANETMPPVMYKIIDDDFAGGYKDISVTFPATSFNRQFTDIFRIFYKKEEFKNG